MNPKLGRFFAFPAGLRWRVPAVAALVFAACGVPSCSQPSPTGTPDGGGRASATAGAPTSQPAVRVIAAEGTVDIGAVRPNSVHLLTFIIENPGPKALHIQAIRGDCECITAIDPPKEVPAGGSVEVKAKYVVPEKVQEYVAALLVRTDSPERKMISLKVHSKSAR